MPQVAAHPLKTTTPRFANPGFLVRMRPLPSEVVLGESRPPDVRKSFGFKTKEIH